jgi:predicted nucleic acid-binding protein
VRRPRVYLDVCALKRGWDDPTQLRVQLEADAVSAILLLAEKGVLMLLRSVFHDMENARNTDSRRQEAVATFLETLAMESLDLDALRSRIVTFERAAIQTIDAAHLAAAELLEADCFVTCDDRLVKRAVRARCRVPVLGPVHYLSERHP